MKRFVLKPIVLVFAFLSMAISAFGQSNTTNNKNNRQMEKSTMKLKIEGGRTFTATLVDNSSTKALKELLAKGDITVHMEDYASMENVVTVHHSKYALSKHSWDEPLQNVQSLRKNDFLNVFTPAIGEVLPL